MFTKSKIRAQVIARLAIFLCQLGSVSPALATAANVNLTSGPAATQSDIRIGELRSRIHTAHAHLFGVGY